jgi:hypothetical protein
MGISASIYFALMIHTFSGPFRWVLDISPSLTFPFAGHIYWFYPDAVPCLHVACLFTTFPVFIWGLIGALLASGRKEQIKVGAILLVLWVIVGFISFFRAVMYIPT